MCGRYTIFTEEDNEQIKEIFEHLKKHPQRDAMKTGDIYPTNLAPVLINRKENPFDIYKWGFELQHLIINARAETIFEKRTFMDPIKTKRCLIPAVGFYEWDKNKSQYLYTLGKAETIYMAGIYKDDKFVIITTQANESLEKVHDRMPVIINESWKEDWLYDSQATMALLSQKQPILEEQLIAKKEQ